MDTDTPVAAESRVTQDDASLREDLRLLAADAKSFVTAELAYQKARAAYASEKAKTISLLGVIAATAIFFAALAAVVGTVIALGPVLGPWGAMAAVTLALLAIALICGLIAMNHLRQMKDVLSEGGDDGHNR